MPTQNIDLSTIQNMYVDGVEFFYLELDGQGLWHKYLVEGTTTFTTSYATAYVTNYTTSRTT